MRTVDSEVYKVPERFRTLADSRDLYHEVTEPGDFSDLPQLAQELGFKKVRPPIFMERPFWHFYDRPNHAVQNFPGGVTRISSTLALYAAREPVDMIEASEQGSRLARYEDPNYTHAILRTSTEPYSVGEVKKDSKAFTRHYIERPRLLGFPSQELTKNRHLLTTAVIGMVLLGAADYYTVQTIAGSPINLGAIIGEGGGPLIFGILRALSERYARGQISDLSQYTAGDRTRNILLGERHHAVEVDVQTELYQSLQGEGVDLTPDDFLEKIYGQIPQELVNRRHAEVDQVKYPRLNTSRTVGNSLLQLISVSHVLQQVEAHLQAANGLKRGLS